MASYPIQFEHTVFEMLYEMTFDRHDVNAGRERPLQHPNHANHEGCVFGVHYTVYRLYDPVVHSLGRYSRFSTLCGFRIVDLDHVKAEAIEHVRCLACVVRAWADEADWPR